MILEQNTSCQCPSALPAYRFRDNPQQTDSNVQSREDSHFVNTTAKQMNRTTSRIPVTAATAHFSSIYFPLSRFFRLYSPCLRQCTFQMPISLLLHTGYELFLIYNVYPLDFENNRPCAAIATMILQAAIYITAIFSENH